MHQSLGEGTHSLAEPISNLATLPAPSPSQAQAREEEAMIDRGPMPLPQLHGVGQLPQLLCQALHFDLGVLQGSIQALDVLQEVPGAEALW